jgi:hypothetical protein
MIYTKIVMILMIKLKDGTNNLAAMIWIRIKRTDHLQIDNAIHQAIVKNKPIMRREKE